MNTAGDASARHKALFLQDEIAFGPDWSLTLGSRFDKHEASAGKAVRACTCCTTFPMR